MVEKEVVRWIDRIVLIPRWGIMDAVPRQFAHWKRRPKLARSSRVRARRVRSHRT